jgi:hypothetical protein
MLILFSRKKSNSNIREAVFKVLFVISLCIDSIDMRQNSFTTNKNHKKRLSL